LEQALRKTGQRPGFSIKSKEAVPKTEVLEQPQYIRIEGGLISKNPLARGSLATQMGCLGGYKVLNP
jgi:hypothetical protein